MSNTRKFVLGAVAVTLTLGAAQFAQGEDMTVGMRTTGTPEQGINRAAKADRAPVAAEPVAPTHTIAIHVDRLPQTSILVRIPVAQQASNATPTPASPSLFRPKSGEQVKASVACEPVVSVLSDIAKRLQPGRCIT